MNVRRLLAGLATAMLALTLSACGGGGGTVVSVNGQNISKADFDSKLEGSPAAKQMLLPMVRSMLIEQYASKNNITVSDDEVNKKINDLKTQYGPTQFDAMVKQQGMTDDDVKRTLKDQIVIDKSVGKDVKVSDSDVAKFFAKNHAAFDKAPSVHARHILVPDMKTAQMVEQKLKGGAKFEDLAKQYSQDPGSKDKGGDLGFFRSGQMVPSFEKAAYKQPLNVVGPPVKSPFGYHIIEVLERTPGQKATLASAHDQIVAQLRQQQESPLVGPWLQNLFAQAKIDIKDPRYADAFPSPAPAAGSPAAPPSPAK
ncbi:MAG: hypothetical protein DLM50_08915 [Candidatus Meridianibacter frigidus]|nr:MAG: hypothetical protein DLM50_08915 [Candidatus Eremiobacteraeota bacterium]